MSREINLDDVNSDENLEIKYHDSLPISFNPKKHSCTALIPSLGLNDFTKGLTYRAGLIELIGTMFFTLGSCLIATGVARTGVGYPNLPISFLHIFLFMFLISSTAPGSGGHLNPLISMASVFTRVMSISRCAVYVVCQCVGATIGGFMVRLILGEDVAQTTGIGECAVGTYAQEVGTGASFLVEFIFSFFLLFCCYNMVIDPKQGEKAGPILGPLSVSLIFCFCFSVTGLIRPTAGFGGAFLNPARCMGSAIAMFNLDAMWVFWIPAFCAAVLHGALYILVPPDHRTLYSKLDIKRKKLEGRTDN